MALSNSARLSLALLIWVGVAPGRPEAYRKGCGTAASENNAAKGASEKDAQSRHRKECGKAAILLVIADFYLPQTKPVRCSGNRATQKGRDRQIVISRAAGPG